jgi:hypothetical protein
MFDTTDKYFDFDSDKKTEAKSKKRKKQQQQGLLLVLLAAGATYYYFMIFLPEEERKKLEAEIEEKLDKVKKIKKDDYDNITTSLITLQGYLSWKDSTEIKKMALKNKKEALDSAIEWLKKNQLTTEKVENENYRKGKIWELPIRSWADKKIKSAAGALVSEYQEEINLFPDGDKHPNFRFSRTAAYEIYFPPSLQEHYEEGIKNKETNCSMLKGKEDLVLSEDIIAWYKNTVANPVRGEIGKGEANALFYGMTRTGKSATVKNLCFEANKYPLVKIDGSSLTPRIKSKLKVDEKFYYTISELEWTLEKTYGFEREANGEIPYILFVDECNQISNNSLTFDPNHLRFVKDCIEGNKSSRSKETNNLWIMATNHLDQIEEAVYQSGRLSNKLSFSWTWSEFKKICEKAGIIGQIPNRWIDAVLTSEEDKFVKKFNIPIFYKDFLGDDPQQPGKPKFWNLFITNNPDAIYETEEDEVDDDDKPTGRKVTEEIEIGEFLEYFWDLQESGNIKNYKGGFESLKQTKTEDVLDANLPEMSDLLAQSSNLLNQSLENLRQEIEALKQQIQLSTNSGQMTSLQNNINTLFKLVGELRGKIE